MRPRIWLYSILLAFSWLVSPAMANEVGNFYPTPTKNTVNAKLINISKAEFGVFRFDRSGKVSFMPTTKVPLQEGTAYGWRLYLRDYKGVVSWREVYRLPKPPITWGTKNGENFSLSKDSTIAQTEGAEYIENGVIKNVWVITAGDPVGKHAIELYVQNRRIASFIFEVVPVRKPNSTPRI